MREEKLHHVVSHSLSFYFLWGFLSKRHAHFSQTDDVFSRFNAWALCPASYYLTGLRLQRNCPAFLWYGILSKGYAAVPRIIPIWVVETVTMKMLPVRSIQEVGANSRGQVITWPVSTRTTAVILTALTNSGAARWRKVILFYVIHT